MSVVLHRGQIYSPAGASLSAMVVTDGVVAWLGTDDAVAAHIGPRDTVVDLRGALVAPAFVDAHVHATATGLALSGLDLAGTRNASDLLDRLATYARQQRRHDADRLGLGRQRVVGSVPADGRPS